MVITVKKKYPFSAQGIIYIALIKPTIIHQYYEENSHVKLSVCVSVEESMCVHTERYILSEKLLT